MGAVLVTAGMAVVLAPACGGAPKYDPSAFRIEAAKACESGDVKKCTLAASMIDLTKASGAELDRRFGYARKACDANVEDACDQPGSDAYIVEMLVKDYARAYAWASYSCDKGSSPGCVSLARLLADGHGVTKDEAKSVEILKGICALAKEISATMQAKKAHGAANACLQLAMAYETGRGVAQDRLRSAKLQILATTIDIEAADIAREQQDAKQEKQLADAAAHHEKMEEYKQQAEESAQRSQRNADTWMQIAGGVQQFAASLPQKGGAAGGGVGANAGFGGGASGGAAGAKPAGPNPACSSCNCPSPGANDHHGAYCAMACQCRCKLNAGGCGVSAAELQRCISDNDKNARAVSPNGKGC